MRGDDFRGKVAVVTGASSGIGRALALGLADEGAYLALAARSAQRLDSLAVECERRGGRAIAIPTKETRGRIVNVSSLGGMLAIPWNTSYVASKFAVIGFSDSLRMELAGDGVSVTVICPSWVVTEFHERFMDKGGRPRGASGQAIYTDRTMTADECARIVIRAARRRKRQVVMRPGGLAVWLKLILPGVVDRLTISRFLRPAVERLAKST